MGAAVYWSLAMIVFGLTAVYAWLEEFPRSVKKEKGVCWFDFATRVAELLLEVAHGVVATGFGTYVQWMSGILGCAVQIGRAFVIAKTVPKSEIKTGRSWYNATGPAVAQGVKWEFGMMAQPWREIPLCGKGEPFSGLEIVEAGLTQHERRMLLAAVQTST
ncbi:hypothetical protein Q9L58_005622 [Maublancomyces gigas]|uniref:Uncharacterized protein n=1 Tax=Discina gigas TaxID=1032678 RepID=A0ABR3GHJ4_9PEZI